MSTDQPFSANSEPDDDLLHEIHELTTAVLTDQSTVAQSERLEDLVRGNPAARREYLRYIRESAAMVSLLDAADTGSQHIRSTGGEADYAAESVNKRPRGQRRYFRYAIAAAVLIAVGTAGVLYVLQSQLPPATNFPTVSAGPIARLTRTVSVTWQGEAQTAPTDADIPQRAVDKLPRALALGEKLQLLSGLAEIEYATGVRVIVQGPAEYVVGGEKAKGRGQTAEVAESQSETRNSGLLSYGKLTAHVPPSAIGFTIASPVLTVTDLGTEFGMTVAHGVRTVANPADAEPLSTEVHVFDGRVQLMPVSLNAKSEILSAGQALRIVLATAADGGPPTTKTLPATPEQFVRNLAGPAGRLVFVEDWESISQGEPVWQNNGWSERFYRLEPPIQVDYVVKATPSEAPLFGHHVLRFHDDHEDPTFANLFIYRPIPEEAVGQPLTIRFDFRALRNRTAARFYGLGVPLQLAPQLVLDGQPPLMAIETGAWYRLTLNIPALSPNAREMELSLARLSDGRFAEPRTWRVPLTPLTLDINPTAAKTFYFGFAPAERQALGGIWELDNIEVRVREASQLGRQR